MLGSLNPIQILGGDVAKQFVYATVVYGYWPIQVHLSYITGFTRNFYWIRVLCLDPKMSKH
jgi:hypothetical protein